MGAAADAIDAALSTLNNISGSMSTAASQLISEAIGQIRTIVTPDASLHVAMPSRTLINPPRVPQVPYVKIDTYQDPESPERVNELNITDHLSANPPELRLPTLDGAGGSAGGLEYYHEPGILMNYAVEPLNSLISSEVNLTELVITPPKRITAEPLSGGPVNVPKPTFDAFTFDFSGPYYEWLDKIQEYIKNLHTSIQEAQDWLSPADTAFINLLVGAIQQDRWSLNYQEWASTSKDIENQIVFAERYVQTKKLDEAPQFPTGVLDGRRYADRVTLEVETAKKELEALQKIEATLRDKEFDFLKLSLSISANMTKAAFGLRVQQIALLQEAHQLIAELTSQLLSLVSRLIDNKSKEVDFVVRYNETQVERAQLHIDIEKTKLEKVRADLGTNELILGYDENNIQAYRLAMAIIEQRLDKYKIDVDYALYAKKIELLKLDEFKIKQDEVKENLRLYLTLQEHTIADTKEAVIVAKGQALNIDNALNENKKTLVNHRRFIEGAKNMAFENRLRAREYVLRNNAVSAELDAVNEATRVAVRALMAGVEAEGLEKNLKIRQQELEDYKVLYEARRDMQKEQLELLNEFKQYSFDIEQAKSLASTMMDGAQVAGGMATHAFAGLNGVATGIVEEFA